MGSPTVCGELRNFHGIADTLRCSARADLTLLLSSTLIVALMVGGTLVILANLYYRMM